MLSVDINLLFNVINILVLCVLVKLFLFKPVHKILAQRQSLVENDLNEAQKSKTEAQALEQQHRDSMRGIEDEKIAVVAEAQKKAADECDILVSDAKQRANDIIKKAETEAVGRKQEILRQTQDEISEIIVAATKKISGVGSDNDAALYDEFLKKAGESNGESSK